jgi:hypothetical protein
MMDLRETADRQEIEGPQVRRGMLDLRESADRQEIKDLKEILVPRGPRVSPVCRQPAGGVRMDIMFLVS